MLPTEGLRPLSERYFHLHQTLNYHYYLARENVLNLSPETDAVLGRYQPGSMILLIIDYEDEGPAADALVSFGDLIAQNRVSGDVSAAIKREESRGRSSSVPAGRRAMVLDGKAVVTTAAVVE
jgi:hypothetical protein